MTTPNSYLVYCLVGISILMTKQAVAQITNWQTDPSNTTQYQVPMGWKVDAGQEQGVYLWQARENPSNPLGAEISVLSMADFPNSSPTFFLDQLKNTIQGFSILETKQLSANESHYRASGQMNGVKVGCNLIFLRDQNTQFLFLASFSAEENHYEQLGGTAVLYQSLYMNDPFTAATAPSMATTPDIGLNKEVWNMQSLEIQNHLKNQGIIPKKEALLGEWLQSFSYQTGTAAQDVVSGQIAFGERGYGHLFTFKSDNTYSLTYKYNSVNQGCQYQADFFEKGRFKIEGRQLILYPSQYDGSYNLCGKVSQERKVSPATRSFELYMDQEAKRLLIIGQAFEYSTSTQTDANGNEYIQEGFNKTQ